MMPLLFLMLLVCIKTRAMHTEWDDGAVNFINARRRLDGTAIEHLSRVGQLLDRYMAEGLPEVIGWFDYQALLVLRVLSAHQLSNGVYGGVAEIGVHHGKSFAALSMLNLDSVSGSGSQIALAVDVFDDQLLNTDGSGEGDLEIFRQTLQTWCGDECLAPDRLKILQQDSRKLTAAQVVNASHGVRPRIFSIDGSHTAEHTEADMHSAVGSVCEVRWLVLHLKRAVFVCAGYTTLGLIASCRYCYLPLLRCKGLITMESREAS